MQNEIIALNGDTETPIPNATWPSSFLPGTMSYGATINGGATTLESMLPRFDQPVGTLARSADLHHRHGEQAKVQEIPIEIDVVIGRTKVSVAKLMEAGEGDRFLLDRRFGEPVELQINGRVIGHGELVSDDHDNFIGIRITAIQRDR
jgi:flagellar motor switch protein FliN/FliY